MMKRMLSLLAALLVLLTSASASILPPSGTDTEFQEFTGIACTPAVILCQSLSVLDERGDQGGKKVETLRYSGTKTIPVIESWDGWAKIYYADGTKTGWVRNDYLLMDPAWYLCDEDVQAYAYPDSMAPRVGLLNKGTKLPIITQWDDGRSVNGWVCVSLRGAAGWIRRNSADTASETFFRPEMLSEIVGATLHYQGEAVYANAHGDMETLAGLLTSVRDTGGETAGCPFLASLEVYLADGSSIELQLAADSCCVYRVDGRDYQYARNLWDPDEGGPHNTVILELFGFHSWEEILTLTGNG